jgi:hypothetical protein
LALIYIVAVSLFVASLAYWATSDLHNTTVFRSASVQNYAANAATEGAVQAIGENPEPSHPTSAYNGVTNLTGTGYPSSPGVCWGSGNASSVTISGVALSVWCSTTENLNNSSGANGTRVVTFYTCLSTVSSAGLCQQAPLVKAVVAFDDYPGQLLTTQCNLVPEACGQSATYISWVSVNASSA